VAAEQVKRAREVRRYKTVDGCQKTVASTTQVYPFFRQQILWMRVT